MTQTPISEKTNLAAGARFLKLWGVIPGLADNLIHQLVLLLFLITKLMEAFHSLENMSFLHFCHFLIVQVWQTLWERQLGANMHSTAINVSSTNVFFSFYIHSHTFTYTLSLSHFHTLTTSQSYTFLLSQSQKHLEPNMHSTAVYVSSIDKCLRWISKFANFCRFEKFW